jgi:hypothetical protein
MDKSFTVSGFGAIKFKTIKKFAYLLRYLFYNEEVKTLGNRVWVLWKI